MGFRPVVRGTFGSGRVAEALIDLGRMRPRRMAQIGFARKQSDQCRSEEEFVHVK